MERDSFIFYRSFFEAIDEVDEKQQLIVYRAIAVYALNREEPQLRGIAKVLWRLIKPQLDANWKRFESGCKGAEHGIKGGAPIGNQNARKTPPKQPLNNPTPLNKTTPNVNENENDNDNVNDNGIIQENLINKNQDDTNTIKYYRPTSAENIRKAERLAYVEGNGNFPEEVPFN